jgi:hypothetical protein
MKTLESNDYIYFPTNIGLKQGNIGETSIYKRKLKEKGK